MVLDLLLFFKENSCTIPPSITKRFKTKFFVQTFPRKGFYCSSNKWCRVLNLFQFLFEGVIEWFIINYVCIVQMRSYKCFVDCKHCFLNSVKESLFISPKILLHLFLINMVTETKLAIQDKTQVFLTRRSQNIVVVQNNQ